MWRVGANVKAPDDARGRWTADFIDLLETYGFDWVYFQYESRRDGNVGWTFEATSFESVVTSKFSLNLENGAGLAPSGPLVAAVLPSSRSVQVKTPATAFATIINTGQTLAVSCGITPLGNVPAISFYQTTDPASNQITGLPNASVNIAAGAAQSFILAITPTAPIAPTDVQFNFVCANTNPAPISTGLNTLLLSASGSPVPDIVALVATLTNDGIANIPGTNGTGAFWVATVNVGAGGTITVSADTGAASLPVNISLCQTDPATGQCISAIGSTVTTQIIANADADVWDFRAGQRRCSV